MQSGGENPDGGTRHSFLEMGARPLLTRSEYRRLQANQMRKHEYSADQVKFYTMAKRKHIDCSNAAITPEINTSLAQDNACMKERIKKYVRALAHENTSTPIINHQEQI